MSKKSKIFLGCACLALAVSASALTVSSVFSLPKIEQLADYQPPQVSRVLDRNGLLIAEFFSQKRTVVPIEHIPALVKKAFLAAEDADFYQHNGIDYGGLTRAVLTEIKHAFLGGRRVGGSTITQQAARTLLLSRERTYTRKIKEIILARKMEQALTKDEILGLYLNQIYFGNGVYGIQEAARFYYGVNAANLSLGQAAALASIPKSPNRINPSADQARILERRAYVLKQMVLHGFITAEQEAKTNKEPVVGKAQNDLYLNQAPFYAEAIRRRLIEMLGPDQVLHSGLTVYAAVDIKLQMKAQKALRAGLRQVDKRQGYRGPLLRLNSNESSQLQVILAGIKAASFTKSKKTMWDLSKLVNQYRLTKFDAELRAGVAIELTRGMAAVVVVKQVDDAQQQVLVDLGSTMAVMPFSTMKWARPFNPSEYTRTPTKPSDILRAGDLVEIKIREIGEPVMVQLEQTPSVEGSLVAIDPGSHEVMAMVGGYDFNNSQFNRATQAKRQPGSSFKPFIYAAAIDKEIITAATLITDAPKVYLDSNESAWRPNNTNQQYMGDITVRTCLLKSVNTCSISLLESLGIGPVLELAKNVQINTPSTPFPRDLTIALGSADVIPLDFVNAFTIFPNLGTFAPPIIIKKIKSASGAVIFEAENTGVQVLRPQSAFILSNILRGYITPMVRQHVSGVTQPLAGKTGTSNQWRNAWFVGFSPELVAGVYVGFDDNRSLGKTEFGIQAAMPIWGQFMNESLSARPYREFEQPEGIVWRAVDRNTGSPTEQETAGSMMEAFIEGTEPGNTVHETQPSSFGFFDVG